jgi:PKD repeat protein
MQNLRVVLVAAITVLVALAGCSSSENSTPDSTATPTTTTSATKVPATTTATTTTTGGSSGGNKAPTATLTSDVKQGEAPLAVTFTFDADDADGDKLTWTFDADADGEADEQGNEGDLPREVVFSYETPGTFDAVFSVDDGSGPVTKKLVIEVREAGAPPPPVPEPLTWSGTSSDILIGCLPIESSDGEAYFYFDAALADDWTFRSTPATTWTEWWAGDSHVGNGESEGVIPAGADNVLVCSETPLAPTEFTLTLYHPDHPDSP